MKPAEDLSKRFWKKVDRKSDEECWEWAGATFVTGYGAVGSGARPSKALYAHRVSFELHFGEIPEGMVVCHKCDNRKCVNPCHFFLGTRSDNQRDMARKGRSANRRFHDRQIREIRWLRTTGMTLRALSEKFHVSESTISAIANRRTYQHVD